MTTATDLILSIIVIDGVITQKESDATTVFIPSIDQNKKVVWTTKVKVLKSGMEVTIPPFDPNIKVQKLN